MGERQPKKEGGEKREKSLRKPAGETIASMARPQNKACMGVIYNAVGGTMIAI